MAIINVPAGMTFSKINNFTLQRKTNRLRSKFTGRGQKIAYPYAVWVFDAVINDTDGFLAGKIRSFLVKLEGQANSFRLPVPGVRRPMTGYVGPILSNGGAAARASSIAVDGMTAGVAILAEGDYFTVNDELKLVTEDFASNGQGQGVISFKPPLRKPVGDNVFLKILDPTVLLEAADDDVASWGTAPPKRQSGRLEAVESLDI